MEDAKIVELYWLRNEQAIHETQRKYSSYCYTIAYNILHCPEEAEECENDTYWDAWNAIPPHKPQVLSTFLGKITRRLSLDRWRKRTAEKRGGGEVPLSLQELSDCIPAGGSIDDKLQAQELARIIDSFLRTLPPAERSVFLCRYWYLDSIASIALQFGYSVAKVKTTLFRTRQKLKAILKKEGISV